MSRVLVIAPHMDDEVLGVGGTIQRHVRRGDLVQVCFVCHRKYDNALDPETNERERRCSLAAQEVLGYQEVVHLDLPDEELDAAVGPVIRALEPVVDRSRPEIVYLPFAGDPHQDHRAVARAGRVLFRSFSAPGPDRLLAYEVPSSTEQSFDVAVPAFRPTVFVDVTPYLDGKLAAMRAYEAEMRDWPHPRSPEGIRTLARSRGMQAHVDAAEAFALLRERLEP
jgi:LmbE family N-acetylglucosaminyl deacetylase